VNSTPLIELVRHPCERIAHGPMGLVRVPSGRGLMSRAPTILPGMPSHTPHLLRLVRTFLHKVRGNADEHQGGTAARKRQGVQIN
jgi:hypothetical protein